MCLFTPANARSQQTQNTEQAQPQAKQAQPEGQPPLPIAQQNTPSLNVVIKAESGATKKRLAEIQTQILNGQAEESITALESLMDDSGDQLVATQKYGVMKTVRSLALELLGSLSVEQLKSYRNRVDPIAKRLFDSAVKTKSVPKLTELIDRYSLSSYGSKAMQLLGEWHLENGMPGQAEELFRKLIKPQSTVAEKAELNALVLIAQARQGLNIEQAYGEFEQKYPNSSGRFMGQSQPWQKHIQPYIQAASQDNAILNNAVLNLQWDTFGGSSSRSGFLPIQFSHANWPAEPAYRIPLRRTRVDKTDLTLPVSRPDILAKSSPIHPVLLGDYVYVLTGQTILGIDYKSGKMSKVFEFKNKTGQEAAKDHEVEFTLTVAGKSLLARIGNPALWQDSERITLDSQIVKLDRNEKGLWEVAWSKNPPDDFAWQGTPVYSDGRYFAALVRKNGNRLTHRMIAWDESATLWDVELAETESSSPIPAYRNELISIADDIAIYSANGGVVIAVNVHNGKTVWAYTYPPIKLTGKVLMEASVARHRDINPPVCSDGICVFAPTDSDRFVAVEARSGLLLWESVGFRVETILGVSKGKVVASMASSLRGIRAIELRTGKEEASHGWQMFEDSDIQSFGRGFVTQNTVLWPTRNGLQLLNLTDGKPVRPPIPKPHGNLAYTNGYLIVGNPNEVLIYKEK